MEDNGLPSCSSSLAETTKFIELENKQEGSYSDDSDAMPTDRSSATEESSAYYDMRSSDGEDAVPIERASAADEIQEQEPIPAGNILKHNLQVEHIIPFEDLQIERKSKLGSGGFGVVRKAFWKGRKVAVKKLHVKYVRKQVLKEFEDEVRVFSRLDQITLI